VNGQPPLRIPKPVLQLPSVAALSEIRVALTVPVVSAVPCAVRHVPTFTADEVAFAVVVSVVESPTVTVFVVVVVEPKPCAARVIVLPDTAVTLPADTTPKPAPPDGTPEGIPDGAPDGMPAGGPPACPLGIPLGTPEGIDPPGRAPPLPNPPPHVPFVGVLIEMRVAVKDVAVEEVPLRATAVTQSPAFTFASVVATVWVKVVAAEYVTAT
jgi:hypothetical protein